MAQLSVELTADIKRLEKELDKAKKELISLEDSAERVNSRGTKSFNTFGKGVANTTPTLLEFNRVIQDAPFGIQGVANNLTQLTQNFGQLRQQAGSTGAALRLLVSGLSGPAGILFAVSAITSLLVTFGDRLKSTTQEAKSLDDQLNDLSETFGRDLNINRLQVDILKLQGQEFGSILVQRKQILATQLSTLSNLLEEEQTILALSREEAKRLTFYEGINKAGQDLLVTTGAIVGFLGKITAEELIGDYQRLFGLLGQGITVAQDGVEATADETQKISESEARIKQLQEARLKILREIAQLTKEISESTTPNLTPTQDAFTQGVSSGVGLSAQEILNQTQVLTTKQAPLFDLAVFQAEEFNRRMANVFNSNTIGDAISQAFNGVGQALANGANLFSALGAGILSAFGNFLSAFGQQLIQYGTAALAFSAVSKALTNPLTAAPAAAAAIAIGSALSIAGGALSSIGQRGLGGTGNISGQGSGSFSGSSSTFSSSGGFGDGTVVFEIEGQKLVGVLQRTLGRNARLGGNVSLG